MLSQRPAMNCSMKPRIHRSRCQNSEPISLLKMDGGASSRVVRLALYAVATFAPNSAVSRTPSAQSSVMDSGQPPARSSSSRRTKTVFPPSGTNPVEAWNAIRLVYQKKYSSTLCTWNHLSRPMPRFMSCTPPCTTSAPSRVSSASACTSRSSATSSSASITPTTSPMHTSSARLSCCALVGLA